MKIKTLALCVLASFFTISAANAVVISPSGGAFRITATSVDQTLFGNFVVEFTDADMDMQISAGEITSFSGFNCVECGNVLFDSLTSVPAILGLADGSGIAWGFQNQTGTNRTVGQSDFTYDVSEVSAPVLDTPLPAALPLFLAGILGFSVAAGRKRKRKA